jgi:integrase-like protein
LIGIDRLDRQEKAACLTAVRVLEGAEAEAWDIGGRIGAVDAILTLRDGRKAAFEVTNLAAEGALQLAMLLAKDNHKWPQAVFTPAVQKCQKTDESFPTITPHDLRHTAASLAVSAGANVKAVQRMLGHAKASTTLDVYADLFDDDLDSGQPGRGDQICCGLTAD